jgi:hypothetical protein
MKNVLNRNALMKNFMTNQLDSAIVILNQGIALHPNVQSLKDNLREVEKFR